jgi:NAD(P)H-dependent flavin oxidoreductase YrpB (nitropropane dioxygenase family)
VILDPHLKRIRAGIDGVVHAGAGGHLGGRRELARASGGDASQIADAVVRFREGHVLLVFGG